MIVKEVMTRTFIKHYENDYIVDVTKRIMARGDEGGLVYNERDELTGCFTYKELLEGIGGNAKTLHNVCMKHYEMVQEDTLIGKVHFQTSDVCPVVNKNGEITGFITKSDYLEAIAKTAHIERNRLDAIFNSAHNGILSIDLDGRITDINPPAEKMALTTKEEAVGKFLTDVVTPGGLLDVIRTGESQTEKYKVGNRMYLTHRNPIFDGQRLIGAVGIFQDISEVEFISSELESVKQLVNEMDTIINHSSDGICIVNTKGEIIQQNDRFQQLYVNRFNKQQKKEFQAIIEQVVARGTLYHAVETDSPHDTTLIVSAIPVKNNNGDVERIVFNIKDITEIDQLRQDLGNRQPVLNEREFVEKHFVATSKKTRESVARAVQLAKADVTILLTGEKGVGKETLANIINRASSRGDKPFLKVDCDAIADDSMEYELFGYELGACPEQMDKEKKGLFEQADGGTIFISEIGRMPLHVQVKFLRVLQEQQVTRVGATRPIDVDVRVIASTSENLEALVAARKFREDLFFRINVIPITLPPLRERTEDIPELVTIYSERFEQQYNQHVTWTDEMIRLFVLHRWPGNVAELIYVIEKVYASANEQDLRKETLVRFLQPGERHNQSLNKPIVVNEVIPLKQAVEELEKQLIEKAGANEKSYRQIAKILEVSPSTIIRKVQKREAQH